MYSKTQTATTTPPLSTHFRVNNGGWNVQMQAQMNGAKATSFVAVQVTSVTYKQTE